ncbi:MAG: beta strand repeat-containing protein [Rhodomicrobium sp.]
MKEPGPNLTLWQRRAERGIATPLPAQTLEALLEALRLHRNARRAAAIVGVNPVTAWRIAKRHGIALISLSEHMKERRADPEFAVKQAKAASKAASRWLKAQHAKPGFHKKAIEAARRTLTRLNRDPAFRRASSERLKRLYDDPEFRAKQAAAARAPRNRGFAIAPILYLLGLIGVGAGILFSSYSQIFRTTQTMSYTVAAKNDLQAAATTLAATSWLSNDKTVLCPPIVGSNSPQTPSANCSTSASATIVGTSFANASAAQLPANYASISSAGSPVEVGVFRVGTGVKVLDPWGHYYLYCRWENGIGAANAIAIISAGANGKIETTCGSTTAGGDDLMIVWSTAVTQNRAAVWQTTTAGSSVTGAQFGATGSQVSIGTNGNVVVPGTLAVTGTTSLGALSATNITGTPISGSTGSFTTLAVGGAGQMTVDINGNTNTTGTLGVTGLSTLGQVSTGSSTLSYAAVTNNATVGGTLGVTGATTLGSTSVTGFSNSGASFLGGTTTTSTAIIQIGTSVAATGTSTPLVTVGKGVGSPAVYPFTVDQYGNVAGGTFTGAFNGDLTGSQSGGSVSATTLNASGAAALSGTLGVTGQLNGSSAVFSGNVQAASFNGTFNGSFGGSMTGVLPIANGGTGQTTASSALSNLFGTAGTISGLVPAADVACCIQTSQLSNTGGQGTWSTVYVGADGRVTGGTLSANSANSISDGSGDSVAVGTSTGITYTVNNTTVGNWTSTGLMVGSSKPAVNKLDVWGAQAIGTGYAGVYTAPTNGLIVQGNVGIGTNNPGTNALQVNGTVVATNFVGNGSGLTGIGSGIINSGTAGEVAYYQNNGSTVVGTSTIEIVGGNVGIGITSPGTALDVETASQYNGLFVGNKTNVFASLIGTSSGNDGGLLKLLNGGSQTVQVAANAVSYFNGGNVGIGSTSPANTLDVTGTGIHIASGVPSASVYQLYNSSGTLYWNGNALLTSGGGGGGVTGSGSTGYDAIWTSPTSIGTGLLFESGSKVGIGTAVMTQSLTVNGNIDAMGSNNGYLTEIPNGSTATVLNKLAKMYGANTVTIGTTGDTDGMIGVVVGNAGTSGNAQIAIGGQVGCVFDGAPSAVGDFVTISSSTNGDCHDTGSKTRSTLGLQTIGQVLNTTAISGSIYPVALSVNGAGGNIQMGMVQAVTNGGSCSGAAQGAMATDANGDLLVCDTSTPSIAGSSCAGFNPGAFTFDETGILYVCAK